MVEQIRNALPLMRNLVPEDVEIRLEFDQSRYVADAIRSLSFEALLGVLLTALMVLVFLRDWRSGIIVISTIRSRCWAPWWVCGSPAKPSTS